ncbi:MAG: signal peptide peptidase SppA [Bacteroidia bacterium]|nr:signal peptide peptidase SppA [Bacteroidia bacterium]
MWRFIRLLLAFLLAFFLTMIIGGLLLVGTFSSALVLSGARGEESKPLPKEGWLRIPLSGELREYEQDPTPSFSAAELFLGGPEKRVPTLEELRLAIAEAGQNEKVKGIILQCGDLSARPAQAQQIARWIVDFKQKYKKPVYAYGDYFTEITYFVASCADTIIMYPQSGASVEWNGLVAEGIFFRRFMEKWGIKPRLFRTGRYKSAAESYTEEKYSEDNRQQLTSLLEDVWVGWIDSIAKRRKIAADSLRIWPEQYVFLSAEMALSRGLVDVLLPWQEWTRRFIPEGKKEPSFISVGQLAKSPKKKGEHQIALVYAEGGIGPSGEIQADELVPVLQDLLREDDIKAVVLRVNSPGGDVLDSDKIAKALRTLRSQKPVVVSMGGVAASGGYYISAFANKIVAEPTTITGSIGVIAVLLDVHELLEKHIELRTDRVKVGGRYADFMSPFREAAPEEVARLQSEIDRIYEEFLAIVREGRRYPSRDAVHTIAQGRVWSGVDAKELGLVDTLGGIEVALNLAAREASLTDYRVVTYPEPKSFFEKWFRDIQAFSTRWGFPLWKKTLPEMIQVYWADEVQIR